MIKPIIDLAFLFCITYGIGLAVVLFGRGLHRVMRTIGKW